MTLLGFLVGLPHGFKKRFLLLTDILFLVILNIFGNKLGCWYPVTHKGQESSNFFAPRASEAIWKTVKDTYSLEGKLICCQPRQHVKKQRHYFANKGPSSQGYGFSCSPVWMWELDYKESWAWRIDAFKLLCWRLESPLDCKEIQAAHPKGDQS